MWIQDPDGIRIVLAGFPAITLFTLTALGVTAKRTSPVRQIRTIREGRATLLKRLGWPPNRSGIEKRPGAAAPSVASDGRHHAEP